MDDIIGRQQGMPDTPSGPERPIGPAEAHDRPSDAGDAGNDEIASEPAASDIQDTEPEPVRQEETPAAPETGGAPAETTTAVEVQRTADELVQATRERIFAEEARMMDQVGNRQWAMGFLDGFRFGCGFFVAGCLFWVLVSLVLAAIPFALRALDVVSFPGR